MTEVAVARLTEVIPAVASALGTSLSPEPAWTLPRADAYVVVLVDGLGDVLLREHAAYAPFLTSLT
ncbi:MAG: hypothetical protein ACTHOG_09565, partial [Marmoricola sp.]